MPGGSLPARISAWYFTCGRTRVLAAAGVFTAAVAVADWFVLPNVALGFLYLFPIVATAPFLARWQILLAAAAGAALREALSPFPVDTNMIPRVSMVFLAFAGTGLFFNEMARSRERAIQAEAERRARAEEQSWLIAESNLAALLVVDAGGRVRLANQPAHLLFGFPDGGLAGATFESLLSLPGIDLPGPPGQISHRMLEGTGHRRDGTHFFAQVWAAAYHGNGGPGLAAMVFDTSADRRSRAQEELHEHLSQARVVMGSVWHEVRNLCAAMSLLQAALERSPGVAGQQQLQTLGTLLTGLDKLITVGSNAGCRSCPSDTDPAEVLRELHIILQPSLEELGVAVDWDLGAPLPPVRADHHAMLRVFLNLAQNSLRALRSVEDRRISISAYSGGQNVLVRFADNGPGLLAPERLFQPFQADAEGHGLGLYVSRALIRSFGGELRHLPEHPGACFEIRLPVAVTSEPAAASYQGFPSAR